MRRYITIGSVRGIGSTHRSLRAACEAVKRDQRDCARTGGYSDRTVKALVWGKIEPLTEEERDEAAAYLYGTPIGA